MQTPHQIWVGSLPESTVLTQFQNPQIWKQIEKGDFTHIVMGPEQGQNFYFKRLLRNPAFNSQVCAIVVDEAHIIATWGKEFRPDFSLIYQVRELMPRRIPLFACTATLDRVNQDYILKHAGLDISNMEMIRTSVDRPELSIIIQPLIRGHTRDFRRLHFLVDGADPLNPIATTKSLVYIDNKSRLLEARTSLAEYLQEYRGFTAQQALDFLGRFDADVRKPDQDRIFAEFKKPDSKHRVMISTTSFSVGLNIDDIATVVQFNLPRQPDISDSWQRGGRGMRKRQSQGQFIIFAPAYWFDHLGTEEKQPRQARQTQQTQPLSTLQYRQAYQPAQPSRLREVMLATESIICEDSDESDAKSATSAESQASCASYATINLIAEPASSQALGIESQDLWDLKPVRWSRSETKIRDTLDPEYKAFLNSPCFREYIMGFLQEPDDPTLEYKRPVDTSLCCNGRAHKDNSLISKLPPVDFSQAGKSRKPRADSVQDIALKILSSWCFAEAQDLVPKACRRGPVSSGMFMKDTIQWAISHLYHKAHARKGQPGKVTLQVSSLEQLLEKVPALQAWEFLSKKGSILLSLLESSVPVVQERADTLTAVRHSKRSAVEVLEDGRAAKRPDAGSQIE